MNRERAQPKLIVLAALAAGCSPALAAPAERVFVEAEAFENHGGWKLDTQFIEIMGSPYLLAHGLGRPVEDATTRVIFPAPGEYSVFVRTKDWAGPWKATGAPGRFELLVNGTPFGPFGAAGADWHWQAGGRLTVDDRVVELALHDLTGFDGRCDAIVFEKSTTFRPPEDPAGLADYRRIALGLPETPPAKGPYDLVVVGGGYSGLGAALSAARQGCKVALIQNRPVLGGNGSSEVRVWAQGGTMRGLYPHLGEIIEEFADHAHDSPAPAAEFGDARKEAVVRAEKNIDLYLNHHAIAVETEGQRIVSVDALDTRSGGRVRFLGKFFADTTGHGTIGALAGAETMMTRKGHLGMSNMWYWQDADSTRPWPETPWALPLTLDDFPQTRKSKGPYPAIMKGEWFWESGFDKHPIDDLELIRDWNLRAVFGAFSALKRGRDAAQHRNSELLWVAYIGGNRESRRLVGDVVLTEEDIIKKRAFPDGCVPTTWDLDLHYPKEQYAKKFPDNPFISRAVFGKGVDRRHGYPVPYRAFYSKNIENLFMAGRCISVTHEALGTVRVMRTCGMMGEVVGKAAYLSVKEDTTPRGVYQDHLEALKDLMRQPGAARRGTLGGKLYIPEGAVRIKPHDVDIDPAGLPGIVVDDFQAKVVGNWTAGTGVKGYVGRNYLYHGADAKAEVRFPFKVPADGRYAVRFSYQAHENRSTRTPVRVTHAGGAAELTVNQRRAPALPKSFQPLGDYAFEAGAPYTVTVRAAGVDGFAVADSIQVVPLR